jgi:hypothetical protein
VKRLHAGREGPACAMLPARFGTATGSAAAAKAAAAAVRLRTRFVHGQAATSDLKVIQLADRLLRFAVGARLDSDTDLEWISSRNQAGIRRSESGKARYAQQAAQQRGKIRASIISRVARVTRPGSTRKFDDACRP